MTFDFNDFLEKVLELFEKLVHVLFGWINLPKFPQEFTNSIFDFLDLIFDNATLLGFFVSPWIIRLLIPIIITLWTFKHSYKLIYWLIKKIPFLNIK